MRIVVDMHIKMFLPDMPKLGLGMVGSILYGFRQKLPGLSAVKEF